MKLTFICLFGLCLIGATPNPAAKGRQPVGKVGRFRLHNHAADIYKIDTTTGESWRLVRVHDGPNVTPAWVIVPHYVEREIVEHEPEPQTFLRYPWNAGTATNSIGPFDFLTPSKAK